MKIENLLENHYLEHLKIYRQDLLQKWKQIDNRLFHSKDKNWIVKDFKERTLWDPNLAVFVFKRRRYFNKVTKKYKFLLDEDLVIPPNAIIIPEHRKI